MRRTNDAPWLEWHRGGNCGEAAIERREACPICADRREQERAAERRRRATLCRPTGRRLVDASWGETGPDDRCRSCGAESRTPHAADCEVGR
jgi:hypothetical protein